LLGSISFFVTHAREENDMPQYRHLQVSTHNGVIVARFMDERLTDDLALAEVGEELHSLVAEEKCPKLLLSFAGVTYLSSAMLGKLISINRQLREKGGKLKLCELCPIIQEVFTLTKLNQIIDIRTTESEGLKAFE
jgi:anti-sigma B factor antagonist